MKTYREIRIKDVEEDVTFELSLAKLIMDRLTSPGHQKAARNILIREFGWTAKALKNLDPEEVNETVGK